MGHWNSWYFERLVIGVTSLDTKFTFIEEFFCSSMQSLESLILSNGDPRISSIARVSTPWCGNNDGELFYVVT